MKVLANPVRSSFYKTLFTGFLLVIGLTGVFASDVVDLTFNSNLETTNYSGKAVQHIVPVANGKFLMAGIFNKYNGVPVGGLIRVNADASLDETFNNSLCAPWSSPWHIRQMPDGSFLLLGTFQLDDGTQIQNDIIKINPDGFIDTTFNFSTPGDIFDDIRFDQTGRPIVPGFFQVNVNGNTVNRTVLRLNPDGSPDTTLGATEFVYRISTQGDKIIYAHNDLGAQQTRISRFNSDGSVDKSFVSTLAGNANLLQMVTQPDGKILLLTALRLFRMNSDGGIDSSFQQVNFPFQPSKISLNADGKITTSHSNGPSTGFTFQRFLSDGTPDPSFTSYLAPMATYAGHGVANDGSVYIGDANSDGSNDFVKLHPDGSVDTGYNAGGEGFQSVSPGKIRAIKVLPNQKIIIGGDFDRVRGVPRLAMARLNSDSSLDTSFELPMGTGDNQFSVISNIYGVTLLNNGQMLVNGAFTYKIGGAAKQNIVRLNADGSIDPTFVLGVVIADTFGVSGSSQNHTAISASSGILVATTRPTLTYHLKIPTGLTSTGAVDPGFNPSHYSAINTLHTFAIAVQPDGKVLASGRYESGDINGSVVKSYIVRLNPNGSLDTTFAVPDIVSEEVYAFSLMPDGKILTVRRAINGTSSKVVKLNSDGSVDGSFGTGAGANGKINVIVPFSEGRVLIGGLFGSYNGVDRSNFAVLNENGTVSPLSVSLNREVLSIAVDSENRILIGGGFTTVGDGSQLIQRAYLTRIKDVAISRTILDFDGDGKTDISVFRAANGEWHYRNSSDGTVHGFQFGNETDIPAPADFTGDGKTDIALFRPSTGTWFILRSDNTGFYSVPFGAAGDIPAPGDFDGDGTADIAVFRPSTGVWFANLSGGGTRIEQFGTNGDVPVVADYDGDGISDVAIYRPSASEWWINRSTAGLIAYNFGGLGDIPVHGDYSGDGKADIAVWRPSTGFWYILRSEDNGFYGAPFGVSGDIPTPGDYDGDGTSDFAVFRPNSTYWYLAGSTSGLEIRLFGQTTDMPLPAYYQR